MPDNRKGRQQTLWDQQQIALVKALHASSEVVLGNLVSGVDAIDTLGTIVIDLVH